MSRYTGPKNKLSRREGFDIFNKGEKLRRADVKPGEAGKRRPKKQSDYGAQLRAKQLTKRIYGVGERQFRNYVIEASKSKGSIPEALVTLLESRLDNVVYRLGLAKTRPEARQFVVHGHVLVNGKPETVPSFRAKIDDVVELDQTVAGLERIALLSEEKKEIPGWLVKKGMGGKVVGVPGTEDVPEPIEVVSIIEFYSR